MTTIATCSNITEAQLLKGLLDGAGIAAFVPDDILGNATPQFLFGSGIRVQVSNQAADEARRFIAAAQASPFPTD